MFQKFALHHLAFVKDLHECPFALREIHRGFWLSQRAVSLPLREVFVSLATEGPRSPFSLCHTPMTEGSKK